MAGKRRHWKEKDGRFWARISIPVALRPFFENRTQMSEPLGGDLRVADRNHAAAVARLQAKIDQARSALEVGHGPVSSSLSLKVTEEGIQRAAWEHYEKFLQSIEQKRLSMPTALEI